MIHSPKKLSRRLPLLFLILAASCASNPPPPKEWGDLEFINSSTAGHLAFDNGDFPRAQTLYGVALTRARAVNEPESIVDAGCNLAICEIALKHYDAAGALLREAEYDARRGLANPGEILVLRAKVAYLSGDLSQSADLANAVINSKADDNFRLAAIILKGQISCDRGDLAGAKAQLPLIDRFAGAAPGAVPASTIADITKLRGTILRMEHNNEAAARCFDEESELLRASHRYGDMSHSLARAGESYLAASKTAPAADRFFLAARSMAAQGDAKTARQWLGLSISSAQQAGDAAALSRSTALLTEISEASAP